MLQVTVTYGIIVAPVRTATRINEIVTPMKEHIRVKAKNVTCANTVEKRCDLVHSGAGTEKPGATRRLCMCKQRTSNIVIFDTDLKHVAYLCSYFVATQSMCALLLFF